MFRTFTRSRFAALAIVPACLALPATDANAAPATVCIVGGACFGADLKAAIAAASAGATIEISEGEVTQAGIAIGKDLTIRGQGSANSIVQAAATPRTAVDRVFIVGGGVTATVQDVTVRHGYAAGTDQGGGIVNNGTLTLLRVAVTLNSTRDRGTADPADFPASGSIGGGIYNNGTLTIAQSTISGNSTGRGESYATCSQSFCVGGPGGPAAGIYNNVNRVLVITNSTLSGNQTGPGGTCGTLPVTKCAAGPRGFTGALWANIQQTDLNNVTITGNVGSGTGGIDHTGGASGSVVRIRNSIVVGNTDANGNPTDCRSLGGAGVFSGGHNVMGTVNGCEVNAGNGDLVATSAASVLSTTLADNGGPTPTHALVSGSVAIDNGNSAAPGGSDPFACTLKDQRGRSRAGACDSGSFEFNGAPGNPSVTVEQAAAQADPTIASPIAFVAKFNNPVTGFTAADVALGGTAGATTAIVSQIAPNDGTTYAIAVSGMTQGGTVRASVPADKAIDADGLGNLASTSVDNTVTFVRDTTPPVITPNVAGTLGNDGWYRSDVVVDWNVSDAESAVTSPPCNTATISADTAGFTASCSATSTGGTGSNSVSVKRDATAPTLAPSVSPNPVPFGTAAVATPHASDNLSGVASQSCATPDTGTAGSKSVTCTATDKAGNSATASANYVVTGYAWSGFFAPVANLPAVNTAKAGSSVPLKFSLGGNQGLAVLAAGSPTFRPGSCSTGIPAGGDVGASSAGASGLSYDAKSGQYTYVWKTEKGWAGTCGTLVVKLKDGTEHSASFAFR